MKHSSNPRRGRTRNNGRRHSSSKSVNIESNGPETKIRGTVQQVLDKYLAMARDAFSSGDRIAAEGFFQYAEHYYRVIHTGRDAQQEGQAGRGRNDRSPRLVADSTSSSGGGQTANAIATPLEARPDGEAETKTEPPPPPPPQKTLA